MTSALQNRLVGTIIVVALVVILVPEFLDGEKRTNQQSFVDVPPVLEVVDVGETKDIDLSGVEQALNQPIELVNEQAVDDLSAGEDNTKEERSENTLSASNSNNDSTNDNTSDIAPEIVTLSTTSNDSSNPNAQAPNNESNASNETPATQAGWVVQLGSFRHEKNVQALLKKLNDAGYRAYSTPVMTSAGKLNKVFVGPELDKRTLEQALPRLQEITQLKGKITAFEVSAD